MTIRSGPGGGADTFGPLGHYLHDDFGDNSYQNRSGTETGAYYTPGGDFASDVLVGRTRPAWAVNTNQVQVYANNNTLVCPRDTSDGSDYTATVASEASVATWEADLFHHESPTSGNIEYSVIRPDQFSKRPQWAWRNSVTAGYHGLKKTTPDSGTNVIEASSALTSTGQHTVNVTRDASATWELVVNGTSVGTATDEYWPGRGYIALSGGGIAGYDAKHAWERIHIE